MAWQIKADYKTSPPRWVNYDEQGFYTTSQNKARVFHTRVELDQTLEEVRKASPAVTFEPVEIP